jgi:hypothetical protein
VFGRVTVVGGYSGVVGVRRRKSRRIGIVWDIIRSLI